MKKPPDEVFGGAIYWKDDERPNKTNRYYLIAIVPMDKLDTQLSLMPNMMHKPAIQWVIKKGKKPVKKCLFKNSSKSNCKCGKSKVFVNEKKRELYPWQVTLSINWNVAVIERPQALVCWGTLVSRRHILTAYHCLEERLNLRKL